MQEKQHDIHFVAFNVSPEMYPRYWETYHSVNAYDVPWLADGSPNPERKLKAQTNNLQSIADPELDRLHRGIPGQRRRGGDATVVAFEMEELLLRGWLLRSRLRHSLHAACVLALGQVAR